MENKGYLVGITLVATLGGLLFGYDTAVISGTVAALENYFIVPRGLTETAANALLGTVVSSALIGCIVGGASAGIISDKLGRKRGLILAAVLFLISAIGSAWPEFPFGKPGSMGGEAIWIFVTYRIIGGVGVGLASMLSPMYIAEIAPSNMRGQLVSYNQMAIVSGMLLVYFVNFGIGSSGSDDWLFTTGWRWMFASECIPAILFLVLLMGVPKSPRWLVLKGHVEQGKAVLDKLYSSTRSQEVLAEIKASVGDGSSKGKLLSFGTMVILVGILLSAFQQFVGINVVLYYAPEIFRSMGAETDSALMQTIIVGAINMLFTIIAIYTVDRYGRKPLMIIGSLVMGIAMTTLGSTLFLEQKGIATLLAMLAYTAGFAMSWGPVTWVLLSEIFPNNIRSGAMAIAVAAQWISNYIVSATFPIMDKSTYLTEQFHHGFAYWVYAAMAFISALIVWKLVPEPKGKTLEQIENLWRQRS